MARIASVRFSSSVVVVPQFGSKHACTKSSPPMPRYHHRISHLEGTSQLGREGVVRCLHAAEQHFAICHNFVICCTEFKKKKKRTCQHKWTVVMKRFEINHHASITMVATQKRPLLHRVHLCFFFFAWRHMARKKKQINQNAQL